MLSMFGKPWILSALALSLAAVFTLTANVRAYERQPQKPAIVLAAFGTTEVEALEAIINVEKRIQAAFPGYDVHLAFTSNIIRHKWHARAADKAFQKENPGLARFYDIKNPLTTLALIQEGGSRDILVQSLHITNGTEFDDQKSIVTQLAGIKAFQETKKPFPYLAMGDSALGNGSSAQLERAARALETLVAEAKTDGSALVFMGHGNDHVDVKSYRAFTKTMNQMYKYPIYMGLVEGSPTYEDVLAELKKDGVKKVMLAPFMLVAGDHALNDMAGDEDDAWAVMLKKEGFEVRSHLKGLGLINAWADIYVERLKDLDGQMKKAAK